MLADQDEPMKAQTEPSIPDTTLVPDTFKFNPVINDENALREQAHEKLILLASALKVRF